MDVRCTVANEASAWKRLVRARVDTMCAHHGTKNGQCRGIDVRMSAPFVGRELMQCNLLYDAYDPDGVLVGFALLSTRKRSCLYIALMASFRAGVGRRIVEWLVHDPVHSHRFLAARATTTAVGFYLLMQFRLFSWASIDHYVAGGSDPFTSRLQAAVHRRSRQDLEHVRDMLRMHHWIDASQQEWPMLIPRRSHTVAPGIRRCTRLCPNE